MWNWYANNEAIKITRSSGICKFVLQLVLIYCYLERDNEKVLKLYINNSSYFEINSSLF